MFNVKAWSGVMVLAAVAAFYGADAARADTVLTFETNQGLAAPDPNGSVISDGYGGFNWANFFYLDKTTYVSNPSGYANGVVSGTNVAYNGGGGLATMTLASPGVFTFNSVDLTAAWRDGLSVTIQGFIGGVGGTQLYTRTVTVNTNGPSLFNFNYQNIDTLKFSSSGGTRNPDLAGDGTHFVMDNLGFTLGEVGAVPEPSSVVSAAVAVAAGLGLGARRRRRAA